MKRLALELMVVVALLASPAQAVTVTGHAPTQDNAGSCAAPLFVPIGFAPALKVHVRWWLAGSDSTAAAGDSVAVTPGAAFSFSPQLAAGVYRVRCWPQNGAAIACDTTITVAVAQPPPDRVRDFRAP